jgi:uncharacterized protein YjdB
MLCALLIPFASFFLASPVFGQHPNIFINQGEINAIKAKVQANVQPWKNAYNEMISDANSALNQSILSVTYQGNSGHNYYTQAPYDWSNNLPSPCGGNYCDGQINPQADRGDYSAAIALGKAVRDLGLGYAFTGNSNYAEKAIDLINAWTIDSATYMTPEITNNQSNIELYITMPGMFYGADLIWNYSGWNASERSAFVAWVDDLVNDAMGSSFDNNFENWRLVLISSGAVLTGDSTTLNYAFNRWKALVPIQINAAGFMVKEIGRTKSLEYSMYAINAMSQTAEIARHQGTDLYNYETGTGRGLELALDNHAPYLLNISSWPYQQIGGYTSGNDALMELAYSQFQKQAYLNVINARGRPVYEQRTMGFTTLTHGNLFVLTSDDTTDPSVSITAPSNGATVSGNSVTVSASASDNIAIAGVQFKLDGNDLGAEDISAPYSVSWNSALVSNGSHTLSAEARDLAGNTATASITVTVSNAPDSTPPSVPGNLQVSRVTPLSVDLDWSASSDNVAVAGYRIYLNGSNPVEVSTTSIRLTGLDANTTYTFTASAYDSSNNESNPSAGVQASIPSINNPEVYAITASADDGNIPENTVDGNLSTRWSAEGDGQWIQFELDDSYVIESVGLAFFMGNSRRSYFDLLISDDGTNWTTVLADAESSGTTTALETFDFTDTEGSYLRYVGHGNSSSGWNSVTEVQLNLATGTGDTTAPSVPTGLTSSNVTATSVDLDWNASTDNVGVTGYYIYTNGANPVSTTGTSVTAAGLTAASSYTFTVSAFDGSNNESAQSAAVNVTTAGISVSGVDVSPATASLTVSQTIQLTETISPSNATDQSVTWSTSDANVATVNSSGLVTAVGAGTATITATSNDSGSFADTCTVTVSSGGGTSNVALGASATASAYQDDSEGVRPPSELVDGNTGDNERWSAQGYSQWALLDLGDQYDLSEVRLYPYQSRAYQYTVEVSADGSSYTTVVDRSSNTQNGSVLTDTISATGRYVRLTVTGASGYGGGWVSINELEVEGELANGPEPTNVALNQSVIYSKIDVPNDNLVDGSTADADRWSAQDFPQWALIDLGAQYDLSQFDLYPYQDRDYQYTIQVSTDGINYTTVVDRSSNTEGGNVLSDTVSATGRYVRLTVTDGDDYTGIWVSINELEVFGVPSGS